LRCRKKKVRKWILTARVVHGRVEMGPEEKGHSAMEPKCIIADEKTREEGPDTTKEELCHKGKINEKWCIYHRGAGRRRDVKAAVGPKQDDKGRSV